MKARAFTLLELIVVILVILVLIGILLPATGRTRLPARQLKDGTQIRSIHQSMITWASQNKDTYPLPSQVDLNDTIPGVDTQNDPEAKYRKDIPRWMMSLLIYNGCFGPELLVSPAEVNSQIRAMQYYQYSKPDAVAPDKRDKAVMDPSLACYPDEPGGDPAIAGAGGLIQGAACSYAFSPPIGVRQSMWGPTFDPTQCVLGNRGPWYQLTGGKWSLDPTDKRGKWLTPATASNSLRIHGGSTTWEGNIARNDNSVSFETRPDPENLPIKFGTGPSGSGIPKYDNLFANEEEGGDGKSYTRDYDRITPTNWRSRKNNYLRCYGGNGTGLNLGFSAEDKGEINEVKNFWYD